MVSKEDAKRFLSKINPFVEKLPDIATKISKLSDDTEFQNLLGKLGTMGGLFSIGLYLFDKSLENIADTEKTYYLTINRTAISVAKQIIKEQEHDKELTADKEKSTEILEKMMKIHSFEENDGIKEYSKWNGLVPYDHPVIKEFRNMLVQIIRENNLNSQYSDFVTDFNLKFKDEIQNNPTFVKYQKQKALENLSESRRAYFDWILKDLVYPNPIDKKKATSYYIENRAVELEIEDEINQKDFWNMTDYEAEEICQNKEKWKIEDFLKSRDQIKLIAAPFGTGKTSFAKYTTKNIITKNLLGQEKEQDTWIPIYIPLEGKLGSVYREGVEIYQDLNDEIQPQKENILLFCDGLDEYPDPDGIISLKNKILKINSELNSNISISKLKIIFTTRLEAGMPQKLGIKKYIRLLPFTQEQITEFFKKYGDQNLTFEDIKKYGLEEKKSLSYKWDLLKPLFCWMFALSYRDLQITEDMDIGKARLLLYSTFIHSIIKGKYQHSKEIANEKWILRKIAALKTLFEENVYEEDLPRYLQVFIDKEQNCSIDLQNIKLHTVLTSYFKLYEKSNNKHSIEFLHKSFQEYLLAEYYIESILYNKGFRLNIGHPSDVTIEFLRSLLSMIKDSDKKEYHKSLLPIIRSFYLNKSDRPDDDIIPLIKIFKETILFNAIKIFEENKIVYVDFENKSKDSEYWKQKDIPNYKKYYENFIYKAITLFVIKILDSHRNPASLIDYIKDSDNVFSTLKYFPFVNLHKADLHDANLRAVDLSDADLNGANINGADLYCADLLLQTSLAQTSLAQTSLVRIFMQQTSMTPIFMQQTSMTPISEQLISEQQTSMALIFEQLIFEQQTSLVQNFKKQ